MNIIKTTLMIISLLFVFCFLVGCGTQGNKIGAPISSKECKGEDYKYISAEFKKAGFNNIVLEKNKILKIDILTKENSVKEIAIGTTYKFDKNDAFDKDERVKIVYNVKE